VFAPPIAKAQTKAAAKPARKAVLQPSTPAATQRLSGHAAEQAPRAVGVAWDFSKTPIETPNPAKPPQSSFPRSNPVRLPAVRSVLDEPGRPFDAATLKHFQSTFGHDLSSVRLHTDDKAVTSATSLRARAYAVGRHIVLGRGEYAPETLAGRRLLAHELAHVIQQSRGGSAGSGAETPALEASANQAANYAARGYRVAVSGSSAPGIARQSLFNEFSSGRYSWPFLRLALIHTRPVATIIDDINGLSSAERDQAIKDITEERTNQARKLAELEAKQSAQTDAALQAVFDPMFQPVLDILARADQVLDGISATIAVSETPASLISGTVAPPAAEKQHIEEALKPDVRKTAGGQQEPFKETLPGDPKRYLDKLRDITPILIEGHHRQQVDKRGKAEHDDPTKVHSLAELERIGNASKRETDKVFGQFKKGPALKADTKASRGNIHDLWQDIESQLGAMSPNQKREMARALVFYFFQSDNEIKSINATHDADPKFKPLNDEAKDQKQVVEEATATHANVQKLNEIDRGWDASAGGGEINVQIFKQPDKSSGPLTGPNVADRDFMWDMFQTLIHEYLHTLAHPKYNTYAESFGSTSDQYNTLVEGVDSLLDEIVWSAVASNVTDQKLRDDVEGPVYSKLPPMTVTPASRRRYPSYTQAVKLVNVVGIRNLYAAYFLGDVSKIKA
jgi:hypothetical protein